MQGDLVSRELTPLPGCVEEDSLCRIKYKTDLLFRFMVLVLLLNLKSRELS